MVRIDVLGIQLKDVRQARIDAEIEVGHLAGKLEEIENRRPWWMFWAR